MTNVGGGKYHCTTRFEQISEPLGVNWNPRSETLTFNSINLYIFSFSTSQNISIKNLTLLGGNWNHYFTNQDTSTNILQDRSWEKFQGNCFWGYVWVLFVFTILWSCLRKILNRLYKIGG